jgi:hypothetical protein
MMHLAIPSYLPAALQLPRVHHQEGGDMPISDFKFLIWNFTAALIAI